MGENSKVGTIGMEEGEVEGKHPYTYKTVSWRIITIKVQKKKKRRRLSDMFCQSEWIGPLSALQIIALLLYQMALSSYQME